MKMFWIKAQFTIDADDEVQARRIAEDALFYDFNNTSILEVEADA